jgi:hypothetical protein
MHPAQIRRQRVHTRAQMIDVFIAERFLAMSCLKLKNRQ